MNNVEKKLDILKEFFNIGVGGAVTALHKIVKTKLMLQVPDVVLVSVDKAIEMLGPPERQVFAVYIRVSENFPAAILIMLDDISAKKLVKLSTAGLSSYEVDELAFISVLKEIANIMSSYFLSNFSQFIKRPLSPSIPHFVLDMVGAVIQTVISEHKGKETDVLIVKTEIYSNEEKFVIDFLLIPEERSLNLIFDNLPDD